MGFLSWLRGKFHDLTCDRLTIGGTSIGEQDLLRLLHPYQSTGPLSFSLTDPCGEKALHLDAAEQVSFEVHNGSASPIRIPKGSGTPSPDNYHFRISYSNGTLIWPLHPSIAVTSPPAWEVAVQTEGFTQYLCFLNTAEFVISAGDSITLQIAYSGLQAKAGETILTTTCDAKLTPPSSQTLILAVAKGGAGGLAPLWADFGGLRTVFNDGSQNEAVLRLTNLSTAGPISFTTASEIAIRFDVSEANVAWALGTTNQVKNISIPPPNTKWKQISDAGQIWKFQPAEPTTLAAGQALAFTLSNIITNFPPGFANVYVDLHQLPCYGDGTLVAQLEKSPLAYNPDSGTGMALQGTTQGNALHIQTVADEPTLLVENKGRAESTQVIKAFAPKNPMIVVGISDDNCWTIGMDKGWNQFYIMRKGLGLAISTNLGIAEISGIDTLHGDNALYVQYDCKVRKDLHVEANAAIAGGLNVGKDLSVAGRISDKTGEVMPAGSILPYGGSVARDAPKGWLLCDGASYDKDKYRDLYHAIGTYYGGDANNFKVPDLQGRGPMGYKARSSAFDPLGRAAGEETHTLTVTEMPSHNHTATFDWGGETPHIDYNTDIGGSSYLSASITGSASGSTDYDVDGVDNATVTVASTGGGAAHNNLQPYLTVNFIIKT
jgi:microcystin-dependent protein